VPAILAFFPLIRQVESSASTVFARFEGNGERTGAVENGDLSRNLGYKWQAGRILESGRGYGKGEKNPVF
jgi:hypothetical protein